MEPATEEGFEPLVDGPAGNGDDPAGGADAMAVLRALGDPTRFAVYEVLAAATLPLSAHSLSESLGLHANTVRLHLDRLRQAGLVAVEPVRRGTVGRPQHAYRLADTAPRLGSHRPAHELLAAMLADLAERAGARPEQAVDAARGFGTEAGRAVAGSCGQVLANELARLGFEPSAEEATAGGGITFTFLQCPFRDLAQAHPDLVCHLHRGLCEGIVTEAGGNIEDFATLYDHEPCRVTLAAG